MSKQSLINKCCNIYAFKSHCSSTSVAVSVRKHWRYIKLTPAAIAPALTRHVDPFVHVATMYRFETMDNIYGGTTVFFLIVLLVLTPSFLPGRSNSNVLTQLRPIKELPSAPLECTSLQIPHILLSPTFLLHLGWIIGFSFIMPTCHLYCNNANCILCMLIYSIPCYSRITPQTQVRLYGMHVCTLFG